MWMRCRAKVSKKFGSAVHVPVTGTVEGVPVRTTLVSRGKGAYPHGHPRDDPEEVAGG